MSMTVKAYLEKEGGEPEIRRFAVDAGAASSYEYLVSKIPQIFKSLSSGEFHLYWKDPEGDLISFSCSDELTEALGYVPDGVFKVYIKKVVPPTTNPFEGQIHPNVVCDGCNNKIVGSRFKCCVCMDYDLCGVCEAKGLHDEHEMWRIRRPGTACNAPGAGGYMPWKSPWMKGWKKMMKHQWKNWMGGPGPWSIPPGQQQRTCPGQPQPSTSTGQQSTGQKEQEAKQASASPPTEEPGARSNQNGANMTPAEAYLGALGQSVAEMMDPLGVDVSVEVETDGKRKKCNVDATGQGWGWGRGFGRGCRRGWGGASRWGPSPGCPFVPPPQPPPFPGFMPPPGPAGPCPSFPMPGFPFAAPPYHQPEQQPPCNPQEPQYCAAGKKEDGGDVTVKTEQMDMEANSPAAKSPERHDEDWTMVNDQADSATPPPPPPSSRSRHEVTMEQLRNMGFQDDGGWLTSLVTAKDGDLNKVLDAIRAPEKQ